MDLCFSKGIMHFHGLASCPEGGSSAPLSCLANARNLKKTKWAKLKTNQLVSTGKRYRGFLLSFPFSFGKTKIIVSVRDTFDKTAVTLRWCVTTATGHREDFKIWVSISLN